MIPSSVLRRLSLIVTVVGPITTLAIDPWWNFDPINLGKCLILTCLTFFGVGLLAPYFAPARENIGKTILVCSVIFLLALSLPLLTTKAPWAHQIWGQFGRATGILTYLSLLFLFLLIVIIQDLKTYRKIVLSLVVTQSLMTIYCLLQWSGNDPIKWSSFSVFGTLGNVNFLSGFMGIASAASISLVLLGGISNNTRLLLVIITVVDLLLVASTDSIQGLIAFAGGIGLLGFFLILNKKRSLLLPYSALILSGFVLLILSLLDKGPLRSVVFQPTVIYRADYMNAGLKMMLHHPLTGIGIDSYDDWYRAERGVISAFRTGLNRSANTAHNIMIDLGAGGGIPLLLAYLAFIAIVAVSILKGSKAGLIKDPFFVATTCAWFAYQVQATASINQIGVGVWGWILGAMIVGYSKKPIEDEVFNREFGAKVNEGRKKSKTKQKAVSTIPAMSVITATIAFAIGLSISIVPLKIDFDYLKATKQGSLEGLINSAKNPSANSFLMAKAVESASKNNFAEQAKYLSDLLIVRYPRSIYAWSTRLNLSNLSQSERNLATMEIKRLDPYQALCFETDPPASIQKLISSLPPKKQYELARWWGQLDLEVNRSKNFKSSSFSMAQLDQTGLSERLTQMCQA